MHSCVLTEKGGLLEFPSAILSGLVRINHKQPSQTLDSSRDVSNTSTETQFSNDYRGKITANHLGSGGNFLGNYKPRTWRILDAELQFWPRASREEEYSSSTEWKAQHLGVSGVDEWLCRAGNNQQDLSPPPPHSKVQQLHL